ncbi:MAG: hypothetical protein QW116_00780 [Zestosphaera sp.]
MEEAPSGPKAHQVMVGIAIYVLWTVLLPFVNRADVKVLGLPLLWFYYILVSVITATALTILYTLER